MKSTDSRIAAKIDKTSPPAAIAHITSIVCPDDCKEAGGWLRENRAHPEMRTGLGIKANRGDLKWDDYE